MTSGSPSPRLAFKRAFLRYYLELLGPGVADPTDAFASCVEYVRTIRDEEGPGGFSEHLERAFSRLTGELEQDLRRHHRELMEHDTRENVDDRVRECLTFALAQLTSQRRARPR